MALKQDITNKMDQSELLTILGRNSVKAFITTIILIVGFIKLIQLIGAYGYISLGHIILFTSIVMVLYYYSFWRTQKQPSTPHLANDREDILTWRDFFYTTKIDSENQFLCLAMSWVGGLIVYSIIALLIYIVKFCVDNSGSGQVMSILRVVVIGLIATTFYIYTQRNILKTNFWGTIITCTAYGFILSISAYILGMIIGISNMVLGVPITVAILTLQFTFTSIYTYTDLLEWAKKTHIVVIKSEEPVLEGSTSPQP
jgi:hypothetical protein